MANTVNDALKDLYLACGGDPSKLTDNHEVSDYIRDLASVLTGGGGGGSEPFIVTFTIDWDTDPENPTATADKTFSEVKAAFDAGKLIFAKIQNSELVQGGIVDTVLVQAVYTTENDNVVLGNINAYVDDISVEDGTETPSLYIHSLSVSYSSEGITVYEKEYNP